MTEQRKEWKSHVLQFCDDDEGCKVCQFINGDNSTDVLLHVIKVLDGELARTAESESRLLDLLMEENGDA